MKRLLEEARRLIRINSVTSNGNEELSNYLVSILQDRGFKTQVQQVAHSSEDLSKRQFNVIGILGDPLVDKKIFKGLLLNTHLDTVSPGLAENWTETGGDPFSATIKGNKIFGLGAADVKLDFLCKLHAAEKFREKKLKMPIYLVGTCGEEVGMFGAKYLIKSLALNPKYVLVGEPSQLKLVYAHKCLNVYSARIGYQAIERDAKGFNRRIDLHVFGKSAHSSYPHLGVNALYQMIEFLQKAREHGFEMRFSRLEGGDTVNKVPDHALAQFFLTSQQFEDFKRFFREYVRAQTPAGEKSFRVELGGVGDSGVRLLPENVFDCIREMLGVFRDLSKTFEGRSDPGYNPPTSTMNCGQIRQKPGELQMMIDLRLLPDVDAKEIENKVLKAFEGISSRYPKFTVEGVLQRMNPGLNMQENHPFVQICRQAMEEAGIDPILDKKATSTEAAQYFGAGYPAVIFGPGLSQGNAHSPNEYNLVDELEKAVIFYEKVIEKVCV